MRHRKKTIKLNKSTSHRNSMRANLAISLINHGQIKTTLPKAKMLRPYIEKLITIAKRANLKGQIGKVNGIRKLNSVLHNELRVARKLLDEIAPIYESRNGGYSRILKAGYRYGDAAPMAYIELVDRQIV